MSLRTFREFELFNQVSVAENGALKKRLSVFFSHIDRLLPIILLLFHLGVKIIFYAREKYIKLKLQVNLGSQAFQNGKNYYISHYFQ